MSYKAYALVIASLVVLTAVLCTKKYTLCVLATVKNEELVIGEWIDHHVWQGVQHFYIIDNGSTDDTFKVLKPYIDKGLVTYYYMPSLHKQTEHYNAVYNDRARSACKWLMVIDVDEYVYNRTKGSTIASYLNGLKYNKIKSVCLRWKLFGSSGYEYQPKDIRESFLWRKPDVDKHTKHIVNTSYTTTIDIHSTKDADSEKDFPDELALNHYPIMSKEYFRTVKMTRGDAATSYTDHVRNWEYFSRYDADTNMLDEELSELVKGSSDKKKGCRK